MVDAPKPGSKPPIPDGKPGSGNPDSGPRESAEVAALGDSGTPGDDTRAEISGAGVLSPEFAAPELAASELAGAHGAQDWVFSPPPEEHHPLRDKASEGAVPHGGLGARDPDYD